MGYFLIKSDPEYTDAPRLVGLNEKLDPTHFYTNQSHLIPMRTLVRISEYENTVFTDYLYQSIPLFSQRAMKSVLMFDDDFIRKEVILADFKNSQDEMYYLPFFPRFSSEVVLEPSSPYALERYVVTAALKLKLPYLLPVFFVFWQGRCLTVMRLDIVESMLRNGCKGFMLKEAEVIVEG